MFCDEDYQKHSEHLLESVLRGDMETGKSTRFLKWHVATGRWSNSKSSEPASCTEGLSMLLLYLH